MAIDEGPSTKLQSESLIIIQVKFWVTKEKDKLQYCKTRYRFIALHSSTYFFTHFFFQSLS